MILLCVVDTVDAPVDIQFEWVCVEKWLNNMSRVKSSLGI